MEITAADGTLVASGLVIRTEPQRVRLDRPTRLLRLTYVLSGVTAQSSSAAGRALAGVVSLDVGYGPESGPTTVSVSGARVLNVACEDRESATRLSRPCGAPAGSGWEVTLPQDQRDDRVSAQVDLG